MSNEVFWSNILLRFLQVSIRITNHRSAYKAKLESICKRWSSVTDLPSWPAHPGSEDFNAWLETTMEAWVMFLEGDTRLGPTEQVPFYWAKLMTAARGLYQPDPLCSKTYSSWGRTQEGSPNFLGIAGCRGSDCYLWFWISILSDPVLIPNKRRFPEKICSIQSFFAVWKNPAPISKSV